MPAAVRKYSNFLITVLLDFLGNVRRGGAPAMVGGAPATLGGAPDVNLVVTYMY